MTGVLKDRIEAGLLLSEKLKKYKNSNSIVLAIPRGGVPVGYEIAKKLHLPLDVILSKKIPHPYNKEFAIGAVTLDSVIIDEHPDVPKSYIDKEVIRLREVIRNKNLQYRGYMPAPNLKDKNIILVDDGIATGNTMLATIKMLRKYSPNKIIVAVPVCPTDVLEKFNSIVEEFDCLIASSYFRGVGGFFYQFEQVDDQDVSHLIQDANSKHELTTLKTN
jgi:predicted phosphoribosyltransferase